MGQDDLRFVFAEDVKQGARIKVIGVGGGGSNAVNRMISEGVEGVEFAVINTDVQALRQSNARIKVQIGAKLTNGFGTGSNPEIGRRAALEDTDKLIEVLEGADMVFITAGLGGGTGAGAAPILASLAKELDALTVAVVTKPFTFEGAQRMRQAEQALAELASTVDMVIAIPNDRLLAIVPRGTSVFESFRIADDILRQAVQCISEIITTPGLINRDLSDIKATVAGMGYAVLGAATARGENAAVEAARQAIHSPLLEDSKIIDSDRILINITGSGRLPLHDVHEACSIIRKAAGGDDVQINFGVILNESMGDAVKVTVIAKGSPPENEVPPERRAGGVELSLPDSGPAPAPDRLLEPEPQVEENSFAEPTGSPDFDPEDLDIPAYLRHRKLVN